MTRFARRGILTTPTGVALPQSKFGSDTGHGTDSGSVITPTAFLGWGSNTSNSSQLITPTNQSLTLAQRRKLELQSMYDMGCRFPRLDGDITQLDYCNQIGITRVMVIIGSGKNFATVASTNNYIAAAKARGIQVFVEPVNEANLGGSWSPSAFASAHISWFNGVRAVYPANTNPDVKLMLGSIGNSETSSALGSLTPVQWAQAVANAGCVPGNGFDVANYHTYENGNSEFYHWRTVDPSVGKSVQGCFGNPQHIFSEWGYRSDGSGAGETTQSNLMTTFMNYILADPLCIGGMVYSIYDDAEGAGAPSPPAAQGYGLMRLDGSHKPAYNTFKAKTGL